MTKLAHGVRGKDKLDVPIKMIFNYAGNTITNQHSDINRTHEILQDESKCEFIVVWETFMTDSAKYADVLLPDLMPVEQPNFVSNDYAGNMGFIIMASRSPRRSSNGARCTPICVKSPSAWARRKRSPRAAMRRLGFSSATRKLARRTQIFQRTTR